MLARENKELSIEHSCITNITALTRVNGYMFVSLAALLISELFGIVSVLLNLASESGNLFLIVF